MYYKLSKVKELTGLSRSSIYDYMQKGIFPKQYKIGVRSVAWKKADIQQWIDARERV